MKDLLILMDEGTWRFATAPFGAVRKEDRVDPGSGKLCAVREIFRGVSADVLTALAYAGEPVYDSPTVWRNVPLGEGVDGG